MWGINKFWIWLAILGGSAYMDQTTVTLITWMVGVLYFFIYLMFGGPQQLKLDDGVWVKSITQANGLTKIILTDGKDESIQQFTSNRVEVSGNIISIY
jgi:hypothetical protein